MVSCGRIYADFWCYRCAVQSDVTSHTFNAVMKRSFLYSASVPLQTVLSLLCFFLLYRMLSNVIIKKQKFTMRLSMKGLPLFLATLYSVYWLIVLNPVRVDSDVNEMMRIHTSSRNFR